jgi:acyl-ACP thioesterase
MERRPRFNEKIIARSWPRGSNKLFAIRDYDIRDEADNPVIRGRSAWLIVDLEKHRPLRPQALVEPLPPNEGNDALPGPQAGNNPPPSLPDRFAENVAPKDKDTEAQNTAPLLRRVAYSDIDYNGHMNNTRYIQWIQDVIDLEIFNKAKQIRLDINYLSEARYGETISLYVLPITDPSPDTAGTPAQCTAAFAIEGRRTTPENGDAVPVFRAELRTGL